MHRSINFKNCTGISAYLNAHAEVEKWIIDVYFSRNRFGSGIIEVIIEALQIVLLGINFNLLISKIRSQKIRTSRTAQSSWPVRLDEQKCPNLNFQNKCLFKMGLTGNWIRYQFFGIQTKFLRRKFYWWATFIPTMLHKTFFISKLISISLKVYDDVLHVHFSREYFTIPY